MSLFGAGASSASAGQTNTTGDISKDVALNAPPEDGISDLRFSPTSEHLAVASWDKKVRIYEINDQGQSEGKALFEHEAPVLNCCWSPVSSPSFSPTPPTTQLPCTETNLIFFFLSLIGWNQGRRCWCR